MPISERFLVPFFLVIVSLVTNYSNYLGFIVCSNAQRG